MLDNVRKLANIRKLKKYQSHLITFAWYPKVLNCRLTIA